MNKLIQKNRWVLSFALFFSSVVANAAVNDIISKALKDYTGVQRVEVISILGVTPALPLDRAISATVLSENAAGEAKLLLTGFRGSDQREQRAEYRVKYAAWTKGWTVNRRLSPGEALSADALEIRDFNMAEGLAREYRGALLSVGDDPARLEAGQTLIPGQFIAASAVKRIPDLRRGDAVTLEVLSGGVRLTTSAIALEPSSLQQRVRVQAQKSKREFVGILRDGQRVEVSL